jgi:hypothetical protein
MNVPVPPVFLYEDISGKYEVMDGQQRINSIVEFLENELVLEKLKIWPQLNGRTYKSLPPALRRGIERSKLSAITLITDQIIDKKAGIDVRAQVFDRLNTGGEKLNAQELRNCLYSGPFNRLIVEIASHADFTKLFDIPSHADHTLSDGSYDDVLKDNKVFAAMTDCQIALRFFAFREEDYLRGSTKRILDECMQRYRFADEEKIDSFRADFLDTLSLAKKVFGDKAFRLPPAGKRKKGNLSRPLFDAEMISLFRHLDKKAHILARKSEISKQILELCDPKSSSYELIVGRPNTADAIKKRIDVVEKVIVGA